MKLNKQQLKTAIVHLREKAKLYFITLYNLPNAGRYLILSIFLFIFFLIITFPYDYLIKKRIYGFEGNLFRTVDMSGFDFSIFGETYFENLNIVLNNNNEISCKNSILNITLNPVTIFINNRIKSDFQFDSLKYTGRDYDLIFNINGNVDLSIDKNTSLPKNGVIKVILSDSTIRPGSINIPGPMGSLPLKIELINIQSGNLDSTVTNGIVKINSFKLSGNDITCDISGNIELNSITNNTKLDLIINIDSESAVLEQYKDILNSFIKNNLLSLRINGTISKPELTLNKP